MPDAQWASGIKVVVLAEIGSQVECVQSIAVGVIFATDEESFVFAEFTRSGKQTVIGSYILSEFVVWLYGSHGMLLLSVQIQRNIAQTEILEIQRITFQVTVE